MAWSPTALFEALFQRSFSIPPFARTLFFPVVCIEYCVAPILVVVGRVNACETSFPVLGWPVLHGVLWGFRVISVREQRFREPPKDEIPDLNASLSSKLPVSSPNRRQRLRKHFADVYHILCHRGSSGEVLARETFRDAWVYAGLPSMHVEKSPWTSPKAEDDEVWALLDPHDTGASCLA